MDFLDRVDEMARLDSLASNPTGGLAVIHGRRRLGKTRLLLEWARKHAALYTVADQSAAHIQRQYFAAAVADRVPGFADVEYPDWRILLSRLARESRVAGWRGPIIFDEFPYLAIASPEVPSVLQRWVDHEARESRLVVAVAGSSQRMMQGLILSGDAPLYGRAREVLEIRPLDPIHIQEAFTTASVADLVEIYASWGGVPRYWELAADETGGARAKVERLVLDPLGPLHREPDRLLIEEVPSALEVRPVLDAIGAGAHRVSEIAGRAGRAATSMARPLDRLVGMGLVSREVPFGESEKASRRSLYKISDPFFRMWFRVVAPNRGQLAGASRQARRRLLERFWEGLVALAWEDLCRMRIPRLDGSTPLGRLGPWGPASRWWKASMPEWDLVAESLDGRSILLGEAKWGSRPLGRRALDRGIGDVASRPAPDLGTRFAGRTEIRVLLAPEVDGRAGRKAAEVLVVSGAQLFR